MVILPVRIDVQGNDITVKAQVSAVSLVADVLGYFTDVTPTPGDSNLFLGRDTGNVAAAPTGSNNSAFGNVAMVELSTGNGNTAVGAGALFSLSSGSSNIALGAGAGANVHTGSGNIYIGNTPPADESSTIRIGSAQTATFIAGINGATSASGTAVFVNASGQLGTTTSSLRFKEDVEDMGEASDGLMQLRPVTFRYKAGNDDGSHLLQYGLIAEEVARVYPGLVQLDDDGRPLAVRYHFVNAMLLNEVQKQRRTIAAQQARLADLEAQLAAQRQVAERQEERLRRLEGLLPGPPPAADRTLSKN